MESAFHEKHLVDTHTCLKSPEILLQISIEVSIMPAWFLCLNAQGGGYSPIWATRGRAAGYGFWPFCPEQGI